MKQISEKEGKPFTSPLSLNFCVKPACREGGGGAEYHADNSFFMYRRRILRSFHTAVDLLNCSEERAAWVGGGGEGEYVIYLLVRFLPLPPVHNIAIYGPMIYTVPYVMLLMRANPLRGQVGGGWGMEIETFWAL